MPRVKSLTPTTPVKAYISQENYARMQLLCHDPERARAVFGSVSELINDALSYYLSPERKEFLAWKAQKPSPVSPSSETNANEEKN